MPYGSSGRLPAERASKLGHLQVVGSELVNQLVREFEVPATSQHQPEACWKPVPPTDKESLRLVFAVDGSLQLLQSQMEPFREIAFVKTALLRLDRVAMSKIDQRVPHPLALRDLLSQSALYHSTVFPLKNLSLQSMSNFDAIRHIIRDSLKDQSLNAEPYTTLKWLAYEKWNGSRSRCPSFECPHCGKDIDGLPYDADEGDCPHCGTPVFLTDMIGFHLEMADDTAPQTLASAYMLVHETLLLFTGIRLYWEQSKFDTLQSCLFIKDGPLTLRGQYSKLVIPIRKFFDHTIRKGIQLHVIGQEKSGAFFDHLQLISKHAAPGTYFLPSNDYIRNEVQKRPDRGEPYGFRTNYGNKLFLKVDEFHSMVISVPTGAYKNTTELADLIGAERILKTIPEIRSYQYEGALLPLHLANGIASLSTYPSAQVLRVFAERILA